MLRPGAVVEPANFAIGKKDTELQIEISTMCTRLDGGADRRCVGGMNSCDHIHDVAEGCCGKKTEQAFEIVVQRQELSGMRVPPERPGLGSFQRDSQLLLLFEQCLLGLAPKPGHLQMSLNPGQQLASTERLDQVIVG